MPNTRNLAILIFEDVEVPDFCGPFEVFSVANRFSDHPAFTVLTVAENAGPVVTRGCLSASLPLISRKPLKGECRQDKVG